MVAAHFSGSSFIFYFFLSASSLRRLISASRLALASASRCFLASSSCFFFSKISYRLFASSSSLFCFSSASLARLRITASFSEIGGCETTGSGSGSAEGDSLRPASSYPLIMKGGRSSMGLRRAEER